MGRRHERQVTPDGKHVRIQRDGRIGLPGLSGKFVMGLDHVMDRQFDHVLYNAFALGFRFEGDTLSFYSVDDRSDGPSEQSKSARWVLIRRSNGVQRN